MGSRTTWRPVAVSLALATILLFFWYVATLPVPVHAQPGAYASLMAPRAEASAFPGPGRVWRAARHVFTHPFRDRGPNRSGILLQLGLSLARVLLGFVGAAAVALPLGFVVGMSPLWRGALAPFIQVLRPISPLAWMPLALYTVKGADASAVFVIFICALWPMLLATSHAVSAVPSTWIEVARSLETGRLRLALSVLLPACAPAIVNGMRVSMGIAWLVIVAAEMLVGGRGIGAFVWNSWNDLSLSRVLVAIFLIGVVGMALDALFAHLAQRVSYET